MRRPARGHPVGRRTMVLIVVTVAGVVLATACGPPPSLGTRGASADLKCPIAALEEATGTVEAELWFGGISGETLETMKGMVRRFNQSQDEVRLTANNQGESYSEVLQQYTNALPQPSSLPEIVYLEDRSLPQLVDSGTLLPAENCMEATGYDLERIKPAVRAAQTLNAKFWPGYINVSDSVLYYNQAHYAKAGLDPDDPPATLDEVAEDARAIKQAGIADTPFALKLSPGYFEQWLNGVGVNMVNKSNGRDGLSDQATFATPEAVDLLKTLKSLEDEGLLLPITDTPGQIDQFLALAGGDASSTMTVETSTAVPTIAAFLEGELDPDEVGAAGGPGTEALAEATVVPATAPLPGIEEPGQVRVGGGAFYIVNTSAPAQQAASWRFLEFMLRPGNVARWHIDGGYLPITTAGNDQPAIREYWTGDFSGRQLATATAQLDAVDPSQPGSLIGPLQEFNDVIQDLLERVMLNDAPIEPSLQRAETQVTDALKGYLGAG